MDQIELENGLQKIIEDSLILPISLPEDEISILLHLGKGPDGRSSPTTTSIEIEDNPISEADFPDDQPLIRTPLHDRLIKDNSDLNLADLLTLKIEIETGIAARQEKTKIDRIDRFLLLQTTR